MAEVRTEVKTYRVNYTCPQCLEGVLLPTGMALLSSPPKYPHKCTKCKYEETFRFTYPKVELHEIKE